jgi:hypothetical protein
MSTAVSTAYKLLHHSMRIELSTTLAVFLVAVTAAVFTIDVHT